MLSAALSAFVVLAVPRGGDLAAHLYRTGLVRHGVLVWDNLWFSGQYPLSSYSLLYYLVAAVVGNAVLGIVGVVASAAIFASIAQREWIAVGRWPARLFAVLLAGQAFTAAYPYDMGLAMLLATLWALQRRRALLAACCTVLTLAFSPLAFVFLALALLALFLRNPRVDRRAIVVGAAGLAAAGLQLAVLRVLPTPGLVYPYGAWRLLVGLAVAALGVAVSLRGRGGRPLASLFLVWAAATIVAYSIPSPVGHNLVRASTFVFPLMLLAASLAEFRPRWLAAAALAGALAANVGPYLTMIPDRSTDPAAGRAFWSPLLGYLAAHRAGDGFRVEVVPTANHWEAYYLPQAGYALARGWYTQLDIGDNPALYRRTLAPSAYRRWLRGAGVRYVVVPRTSLGAVSSRREAALVSSGRSGLREVYSGRTGAIYRLLHAVPILTGPGSPTITALDHRTIAGRLSRPGRYLLRVHYTPYWRITSGSLCLTPAEDGMTELEAFRAGVFSMRAIEAPLEVLGFLVGERSNACRR